MTNEEKILIYLYKHGDTNRDKLLKIFKGKHVHNLRLGKLLTSYPVDGNEVYRLTSDGQRDARDMLDKRKNFIIIGLAVPLLLFILEGIISGDFAESLAKIANDLGQ